MMSAIDRAKIQASSNLDVHLPLTALRKYLETTGKPTLEWLIMWSRSGEDPLRAAWRTPFQSLSRREILAWPYDGYIETSSYQDDSGYRWILLLDYPSNRVQMFRLHENAPTDTDPYFMIEFITPPTLAEVLARAPQKRTT